MSKLLKVRGIACGVFVTGRKTNSISANDVDYDVVFAFDGEMSPTSHAGGVYFGLVTSACPSAGR